MASSESMIAVDALALFLYNVDFDDFAVRVFGEAHVLAWDHGYRAEWLRAWQRGFTALWGKADRETRELIVDAALTKYGAEDHAPYRLSYRYALERVTEPAVRQMMKECR